MRLCYTEIKDILEDTVVDLLQLRYFQVVAHENHLTRASQKLNIAQPALSVSIARLEKELGVQLFDRVGRQILLNDNGVSLLGHVDAMLNEWDVAINSIEQLQRASNNQIKLAVTGLVFPQDLILDFKVKHPDISIKQTMIMTDQILPSLTKNKSDFVISSIAIEDAGIASHVIKEETLFIAVSREHPFASKSQISIEETKGQAFVNLPEGFAFRTFTDTICRQAGFKQNVVIECYPSQFSDMVYHNIGIVFATEESMLNGSFHSSIVFLPITPVCSRLISILWEENKPISSAAEMFFNFCLSYYG